jgi:hypothetical protein
MFLEKFIKEKIMGMYALCLTEECPLSKNCYRFLATPHANQPYICGKFEIDKNKKCTCDHFIAHTPQTNKPERS